jgi:hypothetical protein
MLKTYMPMMKLSKDEGATLKISIKVVKQGANILVAACDANLLGKTLKYGKIKFKIHEDYYGGELVFPKEAINLIKNGTIVNLVGSIIIKMAVKANLIHPQAILDISGIPHAQIIKLQ